MSSDMVATEQAAVVSAPKPGAPDAVPDATP